MKKTMILFLSIIFVLAGTLYAKEYYEVASQVKDELTIKVLMDNNPPVVGENNLNIIISDSKGNTIKDAKLKIQYSMPPMNNMPPMNYKTRAKFNNNGYKAKVNLSMPGPWNITVNIKRTGKPLTKMSFSVKVP